MALPTATFDPTKVVTGRQSIIAFTPSGESATNLLVDYVSHGAGLQVGRYQAPGASNGPAFTAGNWVIARGEMVKFKCKEIKKIISLLGSLSGFKNGAVVLYIRDPNDSTTVALISDSFACSLYRDTDEAAFSGANPTEVTLVIESQKDGEVTLTADGTP
jgi:hypothetical protein